MSNLQILNQDGQLVVTTRQVAGDFEKEHPKVTRSVENLIEGIAKNGGTYNHLFIESEYQDEQNKQFYKEYLLTRDGFSLLVMGFTGAKALEWKLKYIQAFNDMEQTLKKEQPKLSKELQAIFMLDAKQQETENRIVKLENNMTIDYSQQEEIRSKACQRVVEILGGKNMPAYKELNKKTFSQIWKDYKGALDVNSYRNTAVKKFADGLNFVTTWKPNRELELMIMGSNSQIRI